MYWYISACIDIWVLSSHGLIHLNLNISFSKLIPLCFIYICVCVWVHLLFSPSFLSHVWPARDWEYHSALGKLCVILGFYPFRAYFPPFSQDNFATRGIDYDFYPSSEHVQWQEGENDRHLFRGFFSKFCWSTKIKGWVPWRLEPFEGAEGRNLGPLGP